MPPVLDAKSLELLIKEEQDFIVCFYKGKRKPLLFDKLFKKYAPEILILVCSENVCPKMRKYIKPRWNTAVYMFSGGKLMDVVSELEDENRVYFAVDKFIRFAQRREVLLLREKLFQRNSKRLNSLLERYYYSMGG